MTPEPVSVYQLALLVLSGQSAGVQTDAGDALMQHPKGRITHQQPETGPRCVACGSGIGPDAIWCAPCWRARQERGRVLPFDSARRARAVARESARPCSTCGGTVLRFTPRGDSSCIGCFPSPEAKP